MQTGDRLPAIEVPAADGGSVALRQPGRFATVVVAVHERCDDCAAYRAQLAARADDVRAWDGRIVAVTADAAPGIATPAVLIADQWGELAAVENAGEEHDFIAVQEVLDWLRYLAMKCPECEGEAL